MPSSNLTPSSPAGAPRAAMNLAAGPLAGRSASNGLTATTLFFASRSLMPGRARMGPMLVTGLLGPMRTVSSLSSCSRKAGLGRARSMPEKLMPETAGFPLRATQKS